MGDKRELPGDASDGELSGAQIDGGLAAKKILQKQLESDNGPLEKACARVLAYATTLVTSFYTNVVEKAPPGRKATNPSLSRWFIFFYNPLLTRPDDWSVKLWTLISRTVIKEVLIDFFAKQTDFSKRLTSWKANLKFEDASTGKYSEP